MTAMTVLLSPLIGCVTLKANSVVAAALFHGTFNGAAVLATFGLQGGNDLLVGMTGLAGLIVLLIANVGLVVFDPALRRVRRCSPTPDPAAANYRE
jgi:hypothetical protein